MPVKFEHLTQHVIHINRERMNFNMCGHICSAELPPSLLSSEYYVLLLSATNTKGDPRIEPRARAAIFGNLELVVHALSCFQKHLQDVQTAWAAPASGSYDWLLEELKLIAPLLIRQARPRFLYKTAYIFEAFR